MRIIIKFCIICLPFCNFDEFLEYKQSGFELGEFIGEYLYYEQTGQDFEEQELVDLLNMNPRDEKQETVVHYAPPKDPLDKWRRKARFRSF